MATIIFANNAQTTLAGPISSGATSVNLAAGTGALFPSPTAGQYFVMTFTDLATKLIREIVNVTARSGDTLTIVRGQESTTARSWLANDIAGNWWTAGSAAMLVQVTPLQQQAGNYAVDSGSANNYAVTLNPIPASLSFLTGVPIRVKITNTNTGTSTLTVNSTPSTVIRNSDGSPFVAGELSSGSIATLVYDGSTYQLLGGSSLGFRNGGSFGPAGSLGNTGTTNWTVPVGVYKVHAKVWSAGGGGGGSQGVPSAASGGGGGAYAEGIYGVTPGQVISVTAGAPGAAGAAGTTNAGTNGGSSSFGAFCSCTGGTQGFGAAINGYQASAGSFGTATGGNILNINGTNGQAGFQVGTAGMGGGGGNAFSGSGSPPTFGAATSGSPVAGGGGGGGNGGVGGASGAGIVILAW